MEIYQMPGFNGVPSGVGFAELTAAHWDALFRDPVGSESGPSSPANQITSDMMFNIPFSEPTCILTAPTTVNLGDWHEATEKDQSPKCLFQITGTR